MARLIGEDRVLLGDRVYDGCGRPVELIGWGRVDLATRTALIATRDEAGVMRAAWWPLDDDVERAP